MLMQAADRERNRVRLETIDAYGGKCSCCGESEPWFLTIEHMNKDGAQHREELGHNGKGVNFYRWLRARGFPKDLGLGVLCHNCNHVSYWRECPHQTGVGLRDLDNTRQRRTFEEITHGDLAMYRRGCRCDVCTATNSKYCLEQYHKRTAGKLRKVSRPGETPHGTWSRYANPNYRCRCEPCVEAAREYSRQRARTKRLEANG